eukprot:CAMPEP_0175833804 /NCGR_PEP_ID=MMETSP0107_2-20121207/15710_1 /TAXON_ID=195067 ORGANISM="Goniomonas pacifica, Strain CCMP1869" /NCGR_SAMPLE_ID=MMETSP0107_2 /ASSEMBLY_ACC=CAM_ASM_000203 /LENGTH=73 /DNA_ID=CAMNT_0017146967 /DNA_START=28 /DNA_END=247 /DNA_ORIENTATION=-
MVTAEKDAELGVAQGAALGVVILHPPRGAGRHGGVLNAETALDDRRESGVADPCSLAEDLRGDVASCTLVTGD